MIRMMNKYSLIFVLTLLVLASCDQQNPFGGPTYDFDGNLAADRVKIDEYLLSTPIDSLYRIHDPSGVVIIVQEEGEGSRPGSNSVVYTNYIGSLLDGSVFDTSIEDVARANDIFDDSRSYTVFLFTIPGPNSTGSAIPGFNFGFRRLRSGSKAVLLIPSPLGYRDSDTNERIPPNSVLRFDVDFLGLD